MSDNLKTPSEIIEPFESYTGNDPYVFVSYAHLDKRFVIHFKG